ncbi:dihydroorotate dehydrogenase B (NAD(+)), electron transfer subunit [Clostridium homopropionicum DSM 5847]|uniref:Dihydroorotate dehydrogenase B (NAD(+)), electron transfer subunit n=1 Tax=Clostridium homopropionicum DSM 5847 TaxID=1121318 RepID=A0A0L6Z5Q8_9CLOT|nr:sulfide/dihydroorotate dehydrogenase-like FAD/NAD-binding protein [Clostridium homopropionicum]KOA18300.1 dihydroorotate dehydrogenase B (NAD(+)), electron transfer subunit [Clostridium homopropionicum DSM 5847]SFF69536.1 sulfide dehydrogenase (flavoprotein) subunit SudB [Clostridium homopropionicum]
MFKIVKKELLVPNIYLMDIEAPRVAKSAQPGQFVIVKSDERGERVPLTICDYDQEKGTVTIVFQTVGRSTHEMANYEEGEAFQDFVGPLGRPSEFVHENLEELKNKKILFISGGVGAAPVYPQVKWLHENGIEADVIMGTRTRELLILEDKMRAVADNVYVTTDDGSYGFKGLVTEKFKELVEKEGKKYDVVVAIGPIIMMKFVALTTKPYGIKTIVSMNPLMVDGTGMCGACRVTIGEETKFACVDGPEFDGHLVKFDEAIRRQSMFKSEEGRELIRQEESNLEPHHHKNGGGCGCCGGNK